MREKTPKWATILFLALASVPSRAPAADAACAGLPAWADLKAALQKAVAAETSGLDHHMWATIVNRDGTVCAVAFSGPNRGAQWLASRVISAQKASTASSLSLDASARGGNPASGPANGLALSTANLWAAVQPGGSLFGLQHSNPVDPAVAYRGEPGRFGAANDPLVGARVGGVNVFGGGLALYALRQGKQVLVGGVGVSGDTSCADHNIAWRLRNELDLDHLGKSDASPGVPGPASLFANDMAHPDNIVFDVGADGASGSGFGHPTCLKASGSDALPAVRP